MEVSESAGPEIPVAAMERLHRIPVFRCRNDFRAATFSSRQKERAMPRGDKSAYTEKQQRKAGHIEESY